MHPEITAQINTLRRAELLAEADHARLIATARANRSKARSRASRQIGWETAPAR